MFKEKLHSPENSKREILKKYDLDQIKNNPNWSEDIFFESYLELKKSLEESESPRQDLVKFYEDAYFGNNDKEFSDYEDRFSMPAFMNNYDSNIDLHYQNINISNWQKSKEIIAGGICKLLNPLGSDSTGDGAPLKKVQYGANRMYKLYPGNFTFIPNEFLEENDILGSDAFTACTALIIKMPQGVFYAHITTRIFGLRELLDQLKEQIDPSLKIHIIRPKWETKVEKDQDIAQKHEENWKKVESEYDNLVIDTYPYIALGSERPEGTNETSILINDDKIIRIGRQRLARKTHEIGGLRSQIKDHARFNYDAYREIDL